MITAVDTNILLDYLNPTEAFNEQSTRRLLQAGQEDALVISETTYAELAASFESKGELDGFLEEAGLGVSASSEEALFLAGKAFLEYAQRRPRTVQCSECGYAQMLNCGRCEAPIRIRQHILADFLIGAHALVHADRLLTRDRNYYGTYFPELRLA